MKKVAGYVRVSTPQQKEDKSHERQKERLQKWADSQEEEIELEIFEDLAISGQNPNREAYQEVMDSLEEYDAILVRELSRFGRDPLQVLSDVETVVEETDTDFISLKEDFDTSTAMGKAMFRMVAVVNGLKSDLARERTQDLYQRKQDEGKGWGRPRKLSDKDLQALLDDREKGVSYNSLGKIYEVSPATARKYCKKYGEEGKHYGQGFGEEEDN